MTSKGLGRSTEYGYDALSRLIRQTNPLGETQTVEGVTRDELDKEIRDTARYLEPLLRTG